MALNIFRQERASNAVDIFTAIMLIAVEFIEVHGPDGQIAFVNTNEISTLRRPTSFDLRKHFPKETHCVIVTTNGKFLGVIETCNELRDQMKSKQ